MEIIMEVSKKFLRCMKVEGTLCGKGKGTIGGERMTRKGK
jgi:hypothetical protein